MREGLITFAVELLVQFYITFWRNCCSASFHTFTQFHRVSDPEYLIKLLMTGEVFLLFRFPRDAAALQHPPCANTPDSSDRSFMG